MLEKNMKNKRIYAAAIYCSAFLLLMMCNILTPYIVDDFCYMYSFYDGERISSLWDIVMSMRVHRYNMNGRIAAHTIVQLLSMLPAWGFDVINAGMYVLHIALLHRIAKWQSRRSNTVLIALFCGAWVCCPAFGQVNLWQDGACNYMWSMVFGILYLIPFIDEYLDGRTVKTAFAKIVFLGFAFFMGAYSETVSAAAIFMSMLLMLLMRLQKHKLQPLSWGVLVMAILGYLFIYTAPAQWRQKSAEMKFSVLFENFLHVTDQYFLYMGFLLLLFALLLFVNIRCKTDKKRIMLALVFFAGSLAANYIMMFASYYTSRSASGAFAFLLGANGILLYPIAEEFSNKKIRAAAAVLILLASTPFLVCGVLDIANSYQLIQENERTIYRCAEEGIMDVTLPVMQASTKYSAIDGLKYLDTDTTDIWPNTYMATYYGVNSILGFEP